MCVNVGQLAWMSRGNWQTHLLLVRVGHAKLEDAVVLLDLLLPLLVAVRL